MTTTTVDHGDKMLRASLRGGSEFTGTLRVLRLSLRRDRIVLPLWVLLLSVPLGSVYVASIEKIYPQVADRAEFATSILSSPAQLAMYGPVYDTSPGAVGIWKAGVFHSLIAIAAILTVIRHTRGEEEAGRAELLASTRVGRYAGLTAALLVAAGGALGCGVIGAASIRAAGVPGNGALAFGFAEAASGIVFAAVAAVAAQLSAGARTARGVAFAVLAVTFTLRAVGDARAGAGPASVFTWLTPQGWSLQLRPFAGDHWWVLVLHTGTALVSIAAAYALLARRDLGAGLIAERPGEPAAGPALAGPFGLAWRLQRGSLLVWVVAFALYGLLIGSVVHGIGDELGSSPGVHELIGRLGGSGALEDSMITMACTLAGLAAAAYSISAALRLYSEEAADRAASVLTGGVGRIRWVASHLLYAVAGPVVLLAVYGALTGLSYGIAAHDVGGTLVRVLGAALVQLPAVWLFTGVTVLLFGLLPRWAPVAWGVLTAGVALFLLGSMAGVPHWIRNLDPFGHLPTLPSGPFAVTPVVALVALACALTAVGLIGFRGRDLR